MSLYFMCLVKFTRDNIFHYEKGVLGNVVSCESTLPGLCGALI